MNPKFAKTTLDMFELQTEMVHSQINQDVKNTLLIMLWTGIRFSEALPLATKTRSVNRRRMKAIAPELRTSRLYCNE